MSKHRAAPQFQPQVCERCGRDRVDAANRCWCGAKWAEMLNAPQEGETPGAPIVLDEDVPTPLAAVYADSEFQRGYQEAKQPPAESGPRPEEEAARIREKYERVKEAHRDGALTVFNPEHNASWVDIATLLDQLQTLREENAQLRYLDGRLNKAGREQFDRAEEAEAKLAAAQEEIARQSALVEKYAAAARVIGLHLREFCDDSLPYDEMIADASRKVAEELTANRACNLYTWKERAERAEQSLREKDAEIERLREALKRAEPALWILATGGHPDAVAIHAECRAALSTPEDQR